MASVNVLGGPLLIELEAYIDAIRQYNISEEHRRRVNQLDEEYRIRRENIDRQRLTEIDAELRQILELYRSADNARRIAARPHPEPPRARPRAAAAAPREEDDYESDDDEEEEKRQASIEADRQEARDRRRRAAIEAARRNPNENPSTRGTKRKKQRWVYKKQTSQPKQYMKRRNTKQKITK